jgi:hypothetical protein
MQQVGWPAKARVDEKKLVNVSTQLAQDLNVLLSGNISNVRVALCRSPSAKDRSGRGQLHRSAREPRDRRLRLVQFSQPLHHGELSTLCAGVRAESVQGQIFLQL